jgi:hypothetical protein
MRYKEINQLNEVRNDLFESIHREYHNHILLGEDLAKVLTEAALTADQIQQLFTQVQQQATAGGGNKTAIGKGVDAAKTVAKAYAGLKELAQNSGPVKGFDAAFDKVAVQLKQYTGGDQGAMQYVEKYRNFATQYPVAQKVIYGALVMAVGVAAAGALGPAGLVLKPAVIGLMRVTDKLLQGEKFSTAAIAGAETFAAGKIAQWAGQSIQNVMGGGTVAPSIDTGSTSAPANNTVTGPATSQTTSTGAATSAATDATSAVQVGVTEIPIELRRNENLSSAYKALINKIQATPDYNVRNLPNDIANRFGLTQRESTALSLSVQKAGGGSMKGFLDAVKTASATGESLEFNNNGSSVTESQVKTLFRNIEEGPMDTIKQAGAAIAGSRVGQAVGGAVKSAAGAIGQKIATGAENLTTKVTANKLNRAWQTAGSPMDSVAIYKFLQQQGIDDAGLKTAFKSAGIAVPRIRTAANPVYNDVMKQITGLSPTDQQKLVQYLKQDLAQVAA